MCAFGKKIPLIGALFTDPMRTKNIKGGSPQVKLENKDIGAAARITATYIPLRAIMVTLAYQAASHFGF